MASTPTADPKLDFRILESFLSLRLTPLTTSSSNSGSSPPSDDGQAESNESRVIISSLAPFQILANPDVEAFRENADGRLGRVCLENGRDTTGRLALDDADGGVDGGGKKESSDIGTRRIFEAADEMV